MVAKALEYLVSHGKTGVLGRFLSASPERFSRGDRVVLHSQRGLTFGVVLSEVTPLQTRLLADAGPGQLLRRADAEDDAARRQLHEREQLIFEASRLLAEELALPIDILDTEIALDGSPPLHTLCKRIQQAEWELLFDHCHRGAVVPE